MQRGERKLAHARIRASRNNDIRMATFAYIAFARRLSHGAARQR
ncbi:hypothetical protein A7982_13812 [Minicystis rosea]|nr:hypothetical protein A7982_13812 [Minicystis rosea]